MWWEECVAGLDMQCRRRAVCGGKNGAGLDMQTGYEGEQCVVGRMEQGWICRQGMKGSRVWWEECGAGLDMQTGYEGEQCVVGRVWSRAGNAARHRMKESSVWWEEWSRAGYADRV